MTRRTAWSLVLGSALLAVAGAQERLVDPMSEETPAADDEPHELYFSRAIYSSYRSRSWRTDYPKADRQFLIGLKKLTNVDVYGAEHALRLDDPDLRRYPLLYTVEVGRMSLTEPERQGLRGYLLAGGFLIVDDFWGTFEWQNFEQEIRAVLPGRPIVPVPLDHPVFHVFYDLDEVLQVPNVYQGMEGGPTWERDGFVPVFLGIFDDDGRLMVAINWNSDLGDAWEWAENPYYPIEYSNFAYRLGVNLIVYGMSH